MTAPNRTEVRKADPAARRRAWMASLLAMCVGVPLILALERYRLPLRDWLLAEPGSAQRVWLVLAVLAVAMIVPLMQLAVHLWSLGGRIARVREFPPPGFRVIQDTPVITGEKALTRARLIRLAALALGICAVVLVPLLLRFELLLRP